MQDEAIYIGLDLGTSGARAIAMAPNGLVLGEGNSLMEDHGNNYRNPHTWWATAKAALHAALSSINRNLVVAMCVDGTSGTIIPVNTTGDPLANGKMYNDPCGDKQILEKIRRFAPLECAAHGPTSGLAKALLFQAASNPSQILHQADWLAGKLCGVYASDDNNALKTGYDPVAGCWPDWIFDTGLKPSLLPDVNEPGSPIAEILPEIADEFKLPGTVIVVAGTTDGCASFLATGAEKPGDGVTVLGTTLTIKMLSENPIFHPPSGVYSHRILGKWLTGGASNTGGNVLLAHFSRDELLTLSNNIDPETDSGLDYYPLLKPGERFPICDPQYPPRMSPVPDKKQLFSRQYSRAWRLSRHQPMANLTSWAPQLSDLSDPLEAGRATRLGPVSGNAN